MPQRTPKEIIDDLSTNDRLCDKIMGIIYKATRNVGLEAGKTVNFSEVGEITIDGRPGYGVILIFSPDTSEDVVQHCCRLYQGDFAARGMPTDVKKVQGIVRLLIDFVPLVQHLEKKKIDIQQVVDASGLGYAERIERMGQQESNFFSLN